jgi:hypothetical protein
VALNFESEKPPSKLPYTDLRKERTVKKLIKENRIPFLLINDGQELYDRAVVFIPQGKSKPAETFTVSLDDAREIARVRDRLQKLI